MELSSSQRPWFTKGVALVGVGAIAIAPTTLYIPEKAPTVAVQATAHTAFTEVQLRALDLPYILTLPIIRARIGSWAQNWAVYLGGFAKSGIGIADSLLSIPGVAIEIVQQIVNLDFAGAWNTFTTAVRDSVVAIGDPLVQSWVWRGQKLAEQQAAYYAALPKAIIDVTNGVLGASNVVLSQALAGTQEFIKAILTFDLGNIVDSAVQGIRDLIGAVGDGAKLIVDGIESAQFAIASAWQAGPPPPFSSTATESSLLAASVVPSSGDPNVFTLGTFRAGSTGDPAVTDPVAIDDTAVQVAPAEGSETVPGSTEPSQAGEPAPTAAVDLPVVDPPAGPTDPPAAGPTEPPAAGPTEPPAANPTAGPTDPPAAGPTDPPAAGPADPPAAGPTTGDEPAQKTADKTGDNTEDKTEDKTAKSKTPGKLDRPVRDALKRVKEHLKDVTEKAGADTTDGAKASAKAPAGAGAGGEG